MEKNNSFLRWLSGLSIPKSTIVASAVAFVLFVSLIISLIANFSDAKIMVSDDGYLVVNGVKTEHKADNSNHTYGAWSSYDETVTDCEKKLAFRICSDCGSYDWQMGKYEDHSFATVTTAPTCVSVGYDTKTCNICGKVEICNETALSAHSFSAVLTSNSTHHWQVCNVCDSISAMAEHSFGANDECTVCSEPIGATEGVVYELSPDGTHFVVVGYTGSSDIVRVAKQIDGLAVKAIGESAFKGNSVIKSVIIPSGVTLIGDRAFQNCSALANIKLSFGVTSLGNYAFSGCSSLTEVVIPDSVETLGNEVFYSCKNITSVTFGNGVVSIGSYAFYNCSKLAGLTLGSNLESVGDYAFFRCTSITSVKLPDSVKNVGDGAFNSCSSLSELKLGNGITYVGSSAFSGCNTNIYTTSGNIRYIASNDNPYYLLYSVVDKTLSSYTVNEGTKVIASSAFSGCKNLANIEIHDGVVGIGASVFQDCTSLASVKIGDGVVSIGDSAFLGCTALTSAEIGDSVVSIGNYAFRNCNKLKRVVLGRSIKSIGAEAFYGYAVSDIYYKGSAEEWKLISVGSNNIILIMSEIHYDYAS